MSLLQDRENGLSAADDFSLGPKELLELIKREEAGDKNALAILEHLDVRCHYSSLAKLKEDILSSLEPDLLIGTIKLFQELFLINDEIPEGNQLLVSMSTRCLIADDYSHSSLLEVLSDLFNRAEAGDQAAKEILEKSLLRGYFVSLEEYKKAVRLASKTNSRLKIKGYLMNS